MTLKVFWPLQVLEWLRRIGISSSLYVCSSPGFLFARSCFYYYYFNYKFNFTTSDQSVHIVYFFWFSLGKLCFHRNLFTSSILTIFWHITVHNILLWFFCISVVLVVISPFNILFTAFLFFFPMSLAKVDQSCLPFQKTSSWFHWSFLFFYGLYFFFYSCLFFIISFLQLAMNSFSNAFR